MELTAFIIMCLVSTTTVATDLINIKNDYKANHKQVKQEVIKTDYVLTGHEPEITFEVR